MKTGSRKLTLKRETLIPLEADELIDVNGGFTPGTVSIASYSISRVSVAVSAKSSAACAKAASEAVKHSARSVSTIASAVSAYFTTKK